MCSQIYWGLEKCKEGQKIAESEKFHTRFDNTCTKILDECKCYLKHGLTSDEESEFPESSL